MAKSNYRTIFTELAKKKRYKVSKPSFNERKNNIDLKLEGQVDGKATTITVDIKKQGKKKSNPWVFIEFKNSKGGKGWLYGSAQFIVFETAQSFIFVPRKKLINYLDSSSIVRWDLPYVDKSWNCKYRLFRRADTLETITQIKIDDLLNVEGHQTWQKS